MRISPVQLLASTIERLRIDPAPGESEAARSDSDVLDSLFFHRHCATAADYWDQEQTLDPGLRSRTYLIRLGIKTRSEGAQRFPYHFEIVASGIFAVSPATIGSLPAEDAAAQYGLTMLLGTIREALLLNTSRMVNGQMLLPTFTFMGQKFVETLKDSSKQEHLPLEGGEPEGGSKTPG